MILALRLGARLRGVETDHLTWGQIEVVAVGVILSDVDGRDVPVHREWADVLVEARAVAGNLEEYMFYPKR